MCNFTSKEWPYSTQKGSKHIHVQYFFVVEKIRNKEVKIIFCPTESMIADFNMKPQQGVLFTSFETKSWKLSQKNLKNIKTTMAKS